MTSLVKDISIEQQIVLFCSGMEMEQKDIDWNEVVEIAKTHGLLSYLYKNLKKTCSNLVPGEIFAELKNYYFANSARNLALCVKLIGIINLFKESNITAVPFKGPVLAETVYGEIGFRSFIDLDILVSREDAVQARNLLIENGFSLTAEIPENQIERYLDCENFFTLYDKSWKINIDLHWEITGRYSLKPIYLESIYNRLEKVKLVDQDVFSLGFEDLLIYLCIHGSSHCWEKLELICSVAEIVKSGKIDDWAALEKKAGRLRCRKMLYAGLGLAEDLFEVNLPEGVEKRIRKTWFMNTLKKQIHNKLFYGKIPFSEKLSWRFSFFHFFIRDSLFDAVKYSLRMFFRPTIREWINYPLPSKFLFLYYILRPFRIISGRR